MNRTTDGLPWEARVHLSLQSWLDQNWLLNQNYRIGLERNRWFWYFNWWQNAGPVVKLEHHILYFITFNVQWWKKGRQRYCRLLEFLWKNAILSFSKNNAHPTWNQHTTGKIKQAVSMVRRQHIDSSFPCICLRRALDTSAIIKYNFKKFDLWNQRQ